MSRPANRQQPVPINKIIKQDGSYICGICRKHHDSKQKAYKCLSACYQAYLSKQGIKEESSSQKKFRCSICKRIYRDRNMAVKCLKSCTESSAIKNEKQSKSIVNQYQKNPLQSLKSNERVIDKLAESMREEKEKAKSSSNTIPYSEPKSGADQKTPLKEQPENSINYSQNNKGPSDENISRIGDAIHEGYKKDTFEKNSSNFKSVDRSNMHKFTRDGRKLFCKKCGNEFTNMEKVIACYDSHPEEERGRKATDEDKKKFRKNGSEFECKYCGNGFGAWVDAVDCYDSHETEKSNSDSDNADDKNKFKRDGAKYLCSSCQKGYFTKMEAVSCYDGHDGSTDETETDNTTVNDDNNSETAEAEADENLDGEINWDEAFGEAGTADPGEEAEKAPEIDLNEGSDKFSRDGSRYVCNNCSQKYFTRMEVIQCFDSH